MDRLTEMNARSEDSDIPTMGEGTQRSVEIPDVIVYLTLLSQETLGNLKQTTYTSLMSLTVRPHQAREHYLNEHFMILPLCLLGTSPKVS
jgi:hypothetical protein